MATATKAVQSRSEGIQRRPPGRLLTPKEASELLGIPDGTLAQWRSQKRGPQFIKLEGRLVRYRPSDLEAYLSGHLVKTEVDNANA